MKTRKGFVSNSSSSSFIVIGNKEQCPAKMSKIDDVLLVGTLGEVEFGWEPRRYSNMYDRINFAYLQTQCAGDIGVRWLVMLDEMLKRRFGAERVEYMINEWCASSVKRNEYGTYREGYIDHASSAREGENTEMFENTDALERFLFCVDSYIQGDNDNH